MYKLIGKIKRHNAVYRDGPAIPYMYSRLISVFEKINVEYEIIL